jgi:TRAP-type C4-dicarboxylate transport system permease small subunit
VKLKAHFNNLEEYILLITFPLLLGVVVLATAVRYLNLGSLVWADETARYIMVWMTFAGISLGIKKSAHLGLEFVVGLFSGPARIWFGVLRTLLVVLFGLLTAFFSLQIISTQISFEQVSPSLSLPMWTVYSAMLMGSSLMTIRAIQIAVPKSGSGPIQEGKRT